MKQRNINKLNISTKYEKRNREEKVQGKKNELPLNQNKHKNSNLQRGLILFRN